MLAVVEACYDHIARGLGRLLHSRTLAMVEMTRTTMLPAVGTQPGCLRPRYAV